MIITCPKCASLGTVERDAMAWVTCPRASCGHQFLAWPPGTKLDAEAELIERRFVCAVHDRPFWVVFGRRTKDELFEVMKVHGDKGWLGEALLERERARLVPSTRTGTAVLVPGSGTALTVAAPSPSFRQLIARAFAPTPATNGQTSVRWQRPTAEQVLATMQAKYGDADALDFSAVDLDGWHCFHCKAVDDRGYFVECVPRCRELVCCGRSERRNGGTWFRCRASCGYQAATAVNPIAVGGERFALPQTAGKAALIDTASPTLITHDRQRRLR